jgi:hypothetical protein
VREVRAVVSSRRHAIFDVRAVGSKLSAVASGSCHQRSSFSHDVPDFRAARKDSSGLGRKLGAVGSADRESGSVFGAAIPETRAVVPELRATIPESVAVENLASEHAAELGDRVPCLREALLDSRADRFAYRRSGDSMVDRRSALGRTTSAVVAPAT